LRCARHQNKSTAYRDKRIPAVQTEQVEDDVAPVKAEYVPAKARHVNYEYVDLKTSTQEKTRRRKQAKRWVQEHVP
jgi:hypothetical protein